MEGLLAALTGGGEDSRKAALLAVREALADEQQVPFALADASFATSAADATAIFGKSWTEHFTPPIRRHRGLCSA